MELGEQEERRLEVWIGAGRAGRKEIGGLDWSWESKKGGVGSRIGLGVAWRGG